VVIDTPGLNAIGAEPELTLGLLPSAHAVVFVLAADTGVTRPTWPSGATTWARPARNASWCSTRSMPCTTRWPRWRRCRPRSNSSEKGAAATLGVPPQRVFALSAREALAARLIADEASLEASRLPPLEGAGQRLLPRRQELLVRSAAGGGGTAAPVATAPGGRPPPPAGRAVAGAAGLRGKSGTKLRMMMERVDAEVADFEAAPPSCGLRAVQMRILRTLLAPLSSDHLRSEIAAMQSAMGSRPSTWAARRRSRPSCGACTRSLDRAEGRPKRCADAGGSFRN
jgi:hypothetical protein